MTRSAWSWLTNWPTSATATCGAVAYAAIVAPAAALAVQRLSWELSPERGTPATLPALALAAMLVTGPIGLIGNRLSRAMERRADQFALQLAGAPEAFVSFERTIALQNVADLDPPRWVSRLLATIRRRPSGSAPRWRSPRRSRVRAGTVSWGVRGQPSPGARMTITQFWPPKPNALAAAVRTSARRGGERHVVEVAVGVGRVQVGGGRQHPVADRQQAGHRRQGARRRRSGGPPSTWASWPGRRRRRSPRAIRIARVSAASLALVAVPWAQM